MPCNHSEMGNDGTMSPYIEGDCPYCEINRLKGELEDKTKMCEELYDHHFREHHTPDYQRIEDLERQLDASQALFAEARAEVERLNKDLGWANKQIQLKDLELDQAMVQIEISSDISCQEVAREIIQYIEDQGMIDVGTVARPMLIYEIAKYDIAEIKTRFKLEG